MINNTETPTSSYFTLQEVVRRSGLSEHTLRYYERIGLLDTVRRDSGNHRRYTAEEVQIIEILACLRAAGMSIDGMRMYSALLKQGDVVADAQLALFEEQKSILEQEMLQKQKHLHYLEQKIAYWKAVQSGDAAIEKLGRKAVSLQLDTSDVKSFAAFSDTVKETLKQTWNRDNFDFLVNNAGIGIHTSMTETTEAQFDQLLNIHFKGVFFLTQTLLPVIVDGGRIINISSGLARFVGPGFSVYGAVKGAVEVLTRYMAVELAPRGITVNVLAPGAIATDFTGGMVRDNAEVNKQTASRIALGRVGLAEDIGPVVAALLSEDTHWITGQRIEASGGQQGL